MLVARSLGFWGREFPFHFHPPLQLQLPVPCRTRVCGMGWDSHSALDLLARWQSCLSTTGLAMLGPLLGPLQVLLMSHPVLEVEEQFFHWRGRSS